MNELIKIETRELAGATVQTCNARDLWMFVESKQEFANWIKGRIEKYGFLDGEDFTVDKFINGRATVIDYHLTIEMAKELAMVESNEKGREVRRYFIECERRAKAAPTAVSANLSRLQLIELAMQAEQERLALEVKVAEQAPKVEALDRIATYSDGSFCVRDAAKNLQIQEKVLRQWLSEHDWIYRRPMGSGWLAYSDKLKAGLLEHKITTGTKADGSTWTDTQVRVTAKGMAKLALLVPPTGFFPPAQDVGPRPHA
jgi:anti-repressor protein